MGYIHPSKKKDTNMIKREIEFIDWDGRGMQRTYWFNMTKAEIAKALMTEDGGLERRWRTALESEDKVRFILVFDELVRLSVGKRTEDGFEKTPSYSATFMASEAYSQMFMDMFSEVGKAMEFFTGIFPQALLEEAKKDILTRQGEPGVPTVDDETLKLLDLSNYKSANEEEPKKTPKPGSEYKVQELANMSDEEFQAWEKRTPPKLMRPEQLQFAYTRRAKG